MYSTRSANIKKNFCRHLNLAMLAYILEGLVPRDGMINDHEWPLAIPIENSLTFGRYLHRHIEIH